MTTQTKCDECGKVVCGTYYTARNNYGNFTSASGAAGPWDFCDTQCLARWSEKQGR